VIAPSAAKETLTKYVCTLHFLLPRIFMAAESTCVPGTLQVGQPCLMCQSGCIMGTVCDQTSFTCSAHPDS
jgi:hypothetical protein